MSKNTQNFKQTLALSAQPAYDFIIAQRMRLRQHYKFCMHTQNPNLKIQFSIFPKQMAFLSSTKVASTEQRAAERGENSVCVRWCPILQNQEDRLLL